MEDYGVQEVIFPKEFLTEARLIGNVLEKEIPYYWDGKSCVRELKDADYNWRQMEWQGWWFEWKARTLLIQHLGGGPGPSYGNTTFDYQNQYTWDLKVHTALGRSWVVLNDQEAVRECIRQKGCIGFVIVVGQAEPDTDESFKIWHDALKGEVSNYVRERIRRGAPSRRRKRAVKVQEYVIFGLNDKVLRLGLTQGWIRSFQKGMRNSNGAPRRAKYQVNLRQVPVEIRAATKDVNGGV